MHILYVASQFEYGKPEMGPSYEHNNFFDCLKRMGHSITYFDFPGLLTTYGRTEMNRRLLDVARRAGAALMFTMLMTDELDQSTIRKITDSNLCTTFNWFGDDHWRFELFSRYWAPCFHWVGTTVNGAEEWYRRRGYLHALKTQWGLNPFLYSKQDLPLVHDVTFVGQPHGRRREFLESLQKAGVKAKAWGHGWDQGRVSLDEMVRIFNQSRINLNFTGSSVRAPSPNDKRRRALSNRLVRLPYGHALKTAAVKALHRFRGSGRNPMDDASTPLSPQIKGRNFEVPGCGGFMLTQPADDLESYYTLGQEVVTFDKFEECMNQIRYFLDHEVERAAIAQAGYARTMREHTYAARFESLFGRMGLMAKTGSTGGEVEYVT